MHNYPQCLRDHDRAAARARTTHDLRDPVPPRAVVRPLETRVLLLVAMADTVIVAAGAGATPAMVAGRAAQVVAGAVLVARAH